NAVANLTDYEGSMPKLKCSYVFQSPCLVPNLTVYDNLKLVCKDGEKIAAMLEAVKLSDKAKSYPVTLSGGQAQRVSIARAFLFDSDVILLDEPFSSLDLKLKTQMTELFFEVWRKYKRTVLYVTHDADEAVAAAQRIIVIESGKIIYDKKIGSLPPRAPNSATELRAELVDVLMGNGE
ncbi:MAG: ATP-binding cassette domain-containing protein, partial [Clostridia bacterium]|nr:ATP-binding cassette domain-containing protein [Clostridia bacterium]